MSALVLVVSAILWAVAHNKSSHRLSRAAAVVQLIGLVVARFERGDIPPAGWAGVAVTMVTLPTLFALKWPQSAFIKAMRIPFAICALCAAAWSAAPIGEGVIGWQGAMVWSALHITIAVIAMSAVSAAALLALHHLRGRGTGLLLLAIVITLLPLFGPRAATVALYQDGEIAKVTASISSGEGDVGVTRVLTARAPLPWDKPLRQTCLAALFLLLSLTLLRRFSGREATQSWPHWVVITLMVVHALALVGSTTARTIAKDKEAVVKVAHNTLSLELAHGEEVKRIDVNEGEFTGGRGSPANTLPLTLLALGLVLAAVFPLPKESTLYPLERKIVSGAIVALSLTIATGIAWSNISWGGAIIADPKLYAALAALACLALYLVAAQPERKPRAMAGWFILAAFLVLLISMIGPELGWTAPSLHHFGA